MFHSVILSAASGRSEVLSLSMVLPPLPLTTLPPLPALLTVPPAA